MNKRRKTVGTLIVVLFGLRSLTPISIRAANTVYFSTSDFGQSKSISVQLPSLAAPMGWDLSHLYTDGVVTATPYVPGDVNRDGLVTVSDISAMMMALSDLSGYQSSHAGMSDPTQFMDVADVNGDGHVDYLDIQALISRVANNIAGGSGALTAVPEPNVWMSMAIGSLLAPLFLWRFRIHQPIATIRENLLILES